MTVSTPCGGTMLCLSRQALPAAPLTDETLLPLRQNRNKSLHINYVKSQALPR